MKQTAGNGKVSGFKWGGKRIVKRLGHGDMTLFYTQAQWERRAARLAAKGRTE